MELSHPISRYETKRRLAEAFPDELADESAVDITVIKTTGDMVLDKALSEAGGKGLFTKELDVKLLNGDVPAAALSACNSSFRACTKYSTKRPRHRRCISVRSRQPTHTWNLAYAWLGAAVLAVLRAVQIQDFSRVGVRRNPTVK